MDDLDDLLTINEVCALFKVTKRTLRKWRKKGYLRDIYPFGLPPTDRPPGNYVPIRFSKREIIVLLSETESNSSGI